MQLDLPGRVLIISLLVLTMFLSLFSQSAQHHPIPPKTIVLTFDDAVKSQYTIVAPLLKKYGFHATFYVCEFPNMFGDSANSMTWGEIQQLSKQGFDIENHTWHHTNINKISNEQFEEELTYINHKCDSLDIPTPRHFAYPAYVVDSSKLVILEKLGFLTARVDGERAYKPGFDNPYFLPSFTPKDDLQKMTAAAEQAHDGAISVFTIHGVPDIKHPWVNTNPATFEAFLKYLRENRYHPISMKELEQYMPKK
jgi:peptidoglycan/xylan/chitin deacetylase (PgdA/CDA1 family)